MMRSRVRVLTVLLGLCCRRYIWKFDPAYLYCYDLGGPVDPQCNTTVGEASLVYSRFHIYLLNEFG